MKRFSSVLLFILFFFVTISSCQKTQEAELTLIGADIESSAYGSSGYITFTANRDWSVSSLESWIHVSPSSGSASEIPITVNIICDSNTTYEDRSGTIMIRVEDQLQTITVKQPANLDIILPTQVFDLQSDSQTIEVEVKANVDYSVDISADWIKQIGTKALTSTILVFSIEKNETFDAREGRITVIPDQPGVSEQAIIVKQAQKDAVIVEKSSYDMPYGGGEIELKLDANVSFDVKPEADWIHHIQTKALSRSTVYLTVDDNPTYSSRKGEIIISQQNGPLKYTIIINQEGRIAVNSIELDITKISLKPGETAILSATVKPDNATDKTITWTSSDSSIASVDGNGKVTASAAGEANITATAGDKTTTCWVIVTDLINEDDYQGYIPDTGNDNSDYDW